MDLLLQARDEEGHTIYLLGHEGTHEYWLPWKWYYKQCFLAFLAGVRLEKGTNGRFEAIRLLVLTGLPLGGQAARLSPFDPYV